MSDENTVVTKDMSHLGPSTQESNTGPITEAAGINQEAVTPEANGMEAGAESGIESGEGFEAQPSAEEAEAKRQAEETAAKEAEDKQKWDSRFTALSKKEKVILEKERALKEMQDKVARYEESLAKAKENPMGILEQAGLSFEDLVNHAIGAEAEPKEEDPDSKYKTLEQKLANMEAEIQRKEQERENAVVEKQINDFKSEIAYTLEENNDKYEIINTLGEQDMVFKVIEEHYANTEELMSIDQAADQVEKYLEDTARKLFDLKKFSNTGVQAQPVTTEQPAAEPSAGEVKVNRSSTTLTNRATVSNAPTTKTYGLHNREESLNAAAELLRKSGFGK